MISNGPEVKISGCAEIDADAEKEMINAASAIVLRMRIEGEAMALNGGICIQRYCMTMAMLDVR